MENQATQLLIQLKNKKTKKPLTFEQLISILHHGEIKPKEIKRFFIQSQNANEQPLNWLDMDFQQIMSISNNAEEYIRQNRQQWKQQQIRKKKQEEQRILMEKQKQRLRLQMIRRNVTKQKMIQMCKQSINKCEKIIEVGADNEDQLQRVKQTVKQLRRDLLILQGNYFQQLRQQGSMSQLSIQQSQNPQIQQIINEIREKKRRQKQKQAKQLQQFKRKEHQIYIKSVSGTLKKIKKIFQHYSKENNITGTTFDQNHQYQKLIDLTIFMKYIKQSELENYQKQQLQHHNKQDTFNRQNSNVSNSTFKIPSQLKSQNVFEIKRLVKQFKLLSINHIWMSLEQFAEIHYRLVGLNNSYDDLKQCGLLQQTKLLSQINTQQQTRSIKASFKQHIQNDYSSYQQNQQSLTQKLQKTQKLKKYFDYSKVDKILNKQKNVTNIIKKYEIIAHTGIMKEDIIKMLSQRLEERKKSKQLRSIKALSHNMSESKFSQISKFSRYSDVFKTEKQSQNILKRSLSRKLMPIPQKLTIPSPKNTIMGIQQQRKNNISLPKLSSVQKQKSIYESLNLLKSTNFLQNQEKNLWQSKNLLLNEQQSKAKQDEKYLNEYFHIQQIKEKNRELKERSIKEKKFSKSKKVNDKILIAHLNQIEQPRMKFT